MDYLVQLHESVKTYLFDELPLESTSKVEKDFRSTTVCPFCHRKLDNGEIAEILEGTSLDDSPKVRHHAHVAGEYTTGKGEVRFFEAGCCTKCNLQLSFNKKNYRLPVYFHNGSHYDFTFIMKIIAAVPGGNLEVIPPPRTRKCRSNTTAFNSRTR